VNFPGVDLCVCLSKQAHCYRSIKCAFGWNAIWCCTV